MIEQIVDIIKTLGSSALPCVVVDQWQGGVILKFGNFSRTIGAGFHWKWPFAETVTLQSTVVTTTSLSAQSVITPDGQVFTAEGVVRWRVDDIRPYICDIWDSANVIVDSAKSAIAETLRTDGVDGLSSKVTTQSRRALKKYGIYVEEVTITTLAPVLCLRLIDSRFAAEPVV